jgi:hypothetical protein
VYETKCLDHLKNVVFIKITKVSKMSFGSDGAEQRKGQTVGTDYCTSFTVGSWQAVSVWLNVWGQNNSGRVEF